MTPAQARALAAILFAAADNADATGADHVDALAELQALDDAARAELEGAIKAASLTLQVDN